MSQRKPSLYRVCSRRMSSIRVNLERLEPRIALSTFNVASESSLRSAISAADSNSSNANTINVTSSITLTDASDGQLEIGNSTGTAKTLTIEGQGAMPSDTVIAGSTTLNSRIFEIVGAGTAGVTVVFKDLEITKGRAHDGGILGGAAAVGGGILIDGGQVTLSNVSVMSNRASGPLVRMVRRRQALMPAVRAAMAARPKVAGSTWRRAN